MIRIKMLNQRLRHCYQVAQYCRGLSFWLGKDDTFADIAEFMGYCHDIGALDELIQTGRWFHTGNHGEVGFAKLVGTELFWVLPDEMLSAVRHHNEDGLADTNNEFLKILRDCDKLEIFRYVCELIDDGELQWLCDEFYEHTTTPAELCKSMMGWLNDINYQWTFDKILELGVLGKFSTMIGGSHELEV